MGNGAKGSGGVQTDFHSMTHDELWAWLTPSSSGTVQGVSDRLAEASKALDQLATDLTTHMKTVHWHGEAGDAFRNWGADTANSTRLLSMYSKDSAKWLSLASTAIAEAHSAMPDSLGTAQASADAARKYHNDPDSAPIGASARSTIQKFQPPPDENGKVSPEALAVAAKAREDARKAAARNMERLAASYSESALQMNSQEVPTFPSPPDRFVPAAPLYGKSSETQSVGSQRQSSDQLGTDPSVSDSKRSTSSDPSQPAVPAEKHGLIQPERPTHLGIDSVDTLPPQTQLPPSTPNVPPAGKPEGPNIMQPGLIPPAFGGTPPPTTSASGKALPSARGLVPPGQPGINSRMPREGITGGRPVTPNTGRPTGGLPRGTVIGHEGTTGTRGPMGRGMPGMQGMHGGGQMGGTGQGGISGGRRLASEGGGVVGGRPQQPGQPSARPFTPGGSGLVRGGTASAGSGVHTGQVGRAGAIPPGSHGANARREEQNGERPDYLSEEEETWQQGSRRVVPPVID
ncbi:hypothetical protein FBY35_6412 [Streptomyces sp. SLBN-118]|uniref:WXG100 family type VII secretion target n=1 Tax=Streptomyces sp. SLBN-118 TaxID=2768454 RepID=UPI00114E1E65|nr:hypothetical protein [Streptomyces sp. SLBN-118]TQK44879.1 hypothetical protein FBY35_6412 [Streptomyces sp. SLBN-118]